MGTRLGRGNNGESILSPGKELVGSAELWAGLGRAAPGRAAPGKKRETGPQLLTAQLAESCGCEGKWPAGTPWERLGGLAV